MAREHISLGEDSCGESEIAHHLGSKAQRANFRFERLHAQLGERLRTRDLAIFDFMMPTATHEPDKTEASGAEEPVARTGDLIAARRRAAAARASAEAAARRAEADEHARAAERQIEISGRGGPDPVRYGDWEVKGIATDF